MATVRCSWARAHRLPCRLQRTPSGRRRQSESRPQSSPRIERNQRLSVTPLVASGRAYPAPLERPTIRGPSAPATMHVSVIPMNNPCSTAPVVALIAKASPAGSSMPPWNIRSRIRLPLSVMNGASSPPRTVSDDPNAISRSAVVRHRNGDTSTGSTPTPSCLTTLDSSTTTTNRLEAAATIFSRKSAPPRPLIRFSAGSTSSAPSTARSISPTSSWTIWIPSSAASSAVARELGTHRSFIPLATRRPTPSVKYFAVDPLPRPSSIPSWTSSRAFSAAARLSASCLLLNCFANSRDAGGDVGLVSEHRAARHQHGRARLHGQRRGLGVDATVDLDLDVWRHRPQPADLVRAADDDLLAAKAWFDCHHID